ncbi:class I SAM-dependent DNA methyltransferase [Mucilaginibacter sp. UYCu711]|uniref:class I SAM-dependent DNA methyltransferase n=1 Tax=Mucilaginibacter sp. UYCu711 TaxID=3156339 RepID=UPI003D1A5173
MDRFGLYAQYYDLLYLDKNYVAETEYIVKLIKQYSVSAQKILNLGCGTGKHDYVLARLGYNVTGIDMAAEMTSQAINNTPLDVKDQLRFVTGDIRTAAINETFDIVISLFHVMSYQVTNQDLSAAVNTAHQHLPDNGLFIFDCWYGPGVLTDPPVTRIKRMANDTINITRLAESTVNSLENTVDVNYTILINPIDSNQVTEIKESHTMRYIFKSEVELLIAGKFKILKTYEWLTDEEPTLNSWNAVFILQKLKSES